jgi:hypothetical protein
MSVWTLLSLPAVPSANSAAGRRATWLELFFDLIFVAAVAQVGAPLHANYSFVALARYAFLFFLIWWAWLGHTLYSTRFDTDDSVQRVLTLVQMFTVTVMAANASEALNSRSAAGFGAAYAVMRIILVLQYVRARRVERSKRLTNYYAAGFGLAALLWLVAAFLNAPERFWIWGAALAVEIATPIFCADHDHELPPHPEHLPERFGLFTIILMGESLVAIMRGKALAFLENDDGEVIEWLRGAAKARERRQQGGPDLRRLVNGQRLGEGEQAVVAEFCGSIVDRFRHAVGIYKDEVPATEAYGNLGVVGTGNQAEGKALGSRLSERCLVTKPFPGFLRRTVPEDGRMAGIGENELTGFAVIAENGGGGVLNGFIRASPKGVVDSPHQLRLIEGIDVLTQKIAEGNCRSAYFLSVARDIGQNNA